MDERVEVDFLMLADRAETVGGKLYMLGGAWDRYTVADFAQPVPISVALGILVPWAATNVEHRLSLTIRDADGRELPSFRVESTFITGRPPHVTAETQRVLLAVPAGVVTLPGPGRYVLAAAIDGIEAKTVGFTAVAAARPAS